jgi:hypothetical protein
MRNAAIFTIGLKVIALKYAPLESMNGLTLKQIGQKEKHSFLGCLPFLCARFLKNPGLKDRPWR